MCISAIEFISNSKSFSLLLPFIIFHPPSGDTTFYAMNMIVSNKMYPKRVMIHGKKEIAIESLD